MIETSNDVLQRATTAPARRSDATAPLRIYFTTREVCVLSGISRNTIKHWVIKKKWIVPLGRLANGQNVYSAWQTVGMCVIGVALRGARADRSYLGRGVVRAMEVFAGLSDEMLLPE